MKLQFKPVKPSTTKLAIPASVLRILDAAPRVELLWLNPLVEHGDYHGFRVRGRAWVSETAVAEVVEEVKAALREPDQSTLCFDPHYGVKLEAGDEAAELLFCFHCRNVMVVEPNGDAAIYPSGTGPKRLLRRLLRSAGVLPWWRFWD